MRRAAICAAAFALLAAPAQAYCRLALTLAVDVSSSVDVGEYALQKGGLLAALADAEVVDAFLAVPGGTVALHVFEWSGRYQQDVVLDWTEIATEADLAAARDRLAAVQRTYAEFPTALGYAVAFATVELRRAPDCERKAIDVSGDGINNDGFDARVARRSHDFTDTTVNGLVIGKETGLYEHYRDRVILGPGAFVERAEGFADVGQAMRRKLIRELGVPQLGMR